MCILQNCPLPYTGIVSMCVCTHIHTFLNMYKQVPTCTCTHTYMDTLTTERPHACPELPTCTCSQCILLVHPICTLPSCMFKFTSMYIHWCLYTQMAAFMNGNPHMGSDIHMPIGTGTFNLRIYPNSHLHSHRHRHIIDIGTIPLRPRNNSGSVLQEVWIYAQGERPNPLPHSL